MEAAYNDSSLLQRPTPGEGGAYSHSVCRRLGIVFIDFRLDWLGGFLKKIPRFIWDKSG